MPHAPTLSLDPFSSSRKCHVGGSRADLRVPAGEETRTATVPAKAK